jgi:hypothetical protein
MKNYLIILSLIFFSSCGGLKNSTSIKIIDGYNYYEQSLPQMKVKLFGDYYFQPFKTKYYRDIDKEFFKYTKNKIDGIKPKRLFQAHTIVQNYYSMLCSQYKISKADSTLLNEIKAQLQESFKVRVSKIDTIKSGKRDVYKISYQTVNSLNKLTVKHTEYIFRNGEYFYRFFFWTTNSDFSVIKEEAEFIMKEIQVGLN